MTALVGQAVTLTVDEAYTDVMGHYGKAVAEVIETGRALQRAKAGLLHGSWLPFVDRLPFSERSAQMLMAIADHPDLANANHGADLPASWRTLSVLSQLPAGEIPTRIIAGEITPELDRSTAEGWARVYQLAKQESVNAWTEAVDGLTRALSWARTYPPPDNLPKSHVQPAEFIERLTALTAITDEWSI